MKEIRLGICGLGTVGGGVLDLIKRNADRLYYQVGAPVKVVKIGSRTKKPLFNDEEISFYQDVLLLAEDPDIDIVLELIGGVDIAKELVRKAIINGKHVVTANKALIASHGEELFSLAQKYSVSLRFEAAVAGSIPIVKILRESLSSNKISCVTGIINGTTNYILSEMAVSDRSFSDILSEAQELGFAEADPTFDIEGIDAGHKLVILASLAFGIPLSLDELSIEGISQISIADLKSASELGYRIKHLAVARLVDERLELSVHLALISATHLISRVDGAGNAILIQGDPSGETLLCGAGAGAGPTASSVVSDVIDLARNLIREQADQVKHLGFSTTAIKPREVLTQDEIVAPWYLRIEAADNSKSISSVTDILIKRDISKQTIVSKIIDASSNKIEIVIITDPSSTKALFDATEEISRLQSVSGAITKIRIEDLPNCT